MHMRLVEIAIEPSAPWRDRMRFTTEDGEFDVIVPYDKSFTIGDVVTVEITKQEQTNA